MTAAKPASRRDRYDEVVESTDALRSGRIPAVSDCLRANGIDPQACVLYHSIAEQCEEIFLLLTPGYLVARVEVPRDGQPIRFEAERLRKGRWWRTLDYAYRWMRTGRLPA